MIPFHYRRISKDFISELDLRTQLGECVVLLGPRYVGKRYVMHCLRRAWLAQQLAPVIDLQLLMRSPVCTGEQLETIVKAGVAKVAPQDLKLEYRTSNPLQAVKVLAQHRKKPVYVLVANVDGIANHLARTFLQSVRMLVEERMVVAVMSGEVDFHELTYGPNSEFDSAHQYVLQGYSQEEFNHCLQAYMTYLRLTFADEVEAGDFLWRLSAGNTYVMRIVIGTILESRTRKQVPVEEPVTIEEIRDSSMTTMNIRSSYGAHAFRQTTQIIERVPDCWNDLDLLISGSTVPMDSWDAKPGPLN